MENNIEAIIEDVNKKKREYEQSLKQIAQEHLIAHFKPFFEKNPEVTYLSWTQYTPYFNDGDSCEFAVNACYAYGGEIPEHNEENEDDFEGEELWDWRDPKQEQLQEHFNLIPEEVYQALFGDHVEIKLFVDKINVEHYNHD